MTLLIVAALAIGGNAYYSISEKNSVNLTCIAFLIMAAGGPRNAFRMIVEIARDGWNLLIDRISRASVAEESARRQEELEAVADALIESHQAEKAAELFRQARSLEGAAS